MMNEMTPEEKLKGAMIFKYLKTGKIPKRKGLFKILFYLSGQMDRFASINMTSSSVTNKRPDIDRTIQIKLKPVNFNLQSLEDILKKYLITYEISYEPQSTIHFQFITIYYSSKQVQWALIDQELRTNHSNNIIEKDGFPRIINYEK